jgi:DNA polymerase, archaea type
MVNVTQLRSTPADEVLFGSDPTPGIVSVWADRSGQARVWQRLDGRIVCTRATFRTWLLATTLDDLPQAKPDPAAPISYRELDGPPNSYRYLLTARPGLTLERAIVAGAAQRGRAVQSIAELGDAYYGVGPVEQYLMHTGRVYFRGLRYDDLHRLQFDLETTALDPRQGRIFMVAIRDSRGFEWMLEAPTAADEARLINDLCALIRERDPDVIENHNLFGFDLPFLEARAARLHVPLRLSRSDAPARLERYADPHGRGPLDRRRMRVSIPGRELIDTLDAVRRYDFAARDLPSHRLKDVARHFGVAAPDRTYLAGASIFDTFQTDPDTVRRYALDDVAEVDALSQRLLHAPFALAGMAPRRYERLASAGPAMGILEPMLVRAYVQAGAALPLDASADDPPDPHAGGGLHLFAAGIAEHVVKADVASLYPSIMRTYGIGPQCDPLGVLLYLVDRLTELRLGHKAAARHATPGSIEHGVHQGNQAAMKVLINSAYGYLGAGHMALFADKRAADEVTRRGRAVLDQVVAGLRERGMALIEADTDGVYVAVPPHWTERDERALVAEVAATLPAGIQLEYEGRYRAMFSHEVKNYALLGYNDDLILRGVALRSSRAEPFGDRFLRDALRCLMQGDVIGVRNVFLQTILALRDRVLPASDLAARMRLSKTPQAYAVSRLNHREQQYEALLNAGRSDWTVGERVRVYRREGGVAAWLPDIADENAIDERIAALNDARDYDVAHYEAVLVSSYAGRLRKAFAPADWEQVFRTDQQPGLFDAPLEQIEPVWIRCRIDQQTRS